MTRGLTCGAGCAWVDDDRCYGQCLDSNGPRNCGGGCYENCIGCTWDGSCGVCGGL